MKKVIVFGTFDIIHKGHLNFFDQAKQYADYLIVVIARDSTARQIKKTKPMNDEKTRLKNIKKLQIIDKAVLGSKKDYYRQIEKLKPDFICLGYDQKHLLAKCLKKELKKRKVKSKIIRLKSYKPNKYKSSKLRKK